MRVRSTSSITHSQYGAAHVRLLVAVVIVGVLSASILPLFVELRAQAHEGSTKASMQMVRDAAEEYARQHDGEYAPDAAALRPYLPERQRLARESIDANVSCLSRYSRCLPRRAISIGERAILRVGNGLG